MATSTPAMPSIAATAAARIQQQQPQPLMTQSDPLDALYRNGGAITTLKKRASGGELLTTHQRHQRDLFSGDLGIPEINSHVGSVVHTFETMAALRRQSELQQQQLEVHQELQHHHEEQQQHFYAHPTTAAAAVSAQQQQQSKHHQQTQDQSSATSYPTSNKKYHQLKRKSHDSRRKLLQLSKQQLLKLSNKPHLLQVAKKAALQSSSSTQTPHGNISAQLTGSRRRSFRSPLLRRHTPVTAAESFASKHYPHIEDDYRKNLFGSLKLLHPNSVQPAAVLKNNNNASPLTHGPDFVENSRVTADANVAIVNAAFDEIFAGYSCADDDDETEPEPNEAALQNASGHSEPDRTTELTTVGLSHRFSHSSNPVKKFPSAYKKSPPPSPPPSPPEQPQSAALAGATLVQRKQRSTNVLSNLLDLLKSLPISKHAALYRIPSDSQLRTDNHEYCGTQRQGQSTALHWNASQMNLLDNLEKTDAEATQRRATLPEPHDEYLLRGTTLSQSFVHQPKINSHVQHQPPKRSSKKTPAPPAPSAQEKPTGIESIVSASGPLFSKAPHANSTNEPPLDQLSQKRQRYRRKDDFDEREDVGVGLRNNNNNNNNVGGRVKKVTSNFISIYDSAEI